MKLRQKTILITGGTSGIGRELVHQLWQQNQVIVLAKDPSKINAMKPKHPSVRFESVDLSDLKQVQ